MRLLEVGEGWSREKAGLGGVFLRDPRERVAQILRASLGVPSDGLQTSSFLLLVVRASNQIVMAST